MPMHETDSWEEITATIKQQADIVQIIGEHVNLKRSGVRYLGLCPFHGEKTPSFSVHPGQQFYYCFGCGASGDVFSFVMNYHHLDFRHALEALAQKFNISLPERKQSAYEQEREKQRRLLFTVNQKVAEHYHRFLRDDPRAQAARSYLAERGILDQMQDRYLLGYAPGPEVVGWNFLGTVLDSAEQQAAVHLGLLAKKENGGCYDRFRDRIMFPIFDARGRVTGFGGRIIGAGNPKYLNSPESDVYSKGRLLFGLYHQREAIRVQRRAVLVEGNFDLLSLIAHGFEPVVAPLGTALTREQVRLLKALADEVVILFDGDEAGLKAAERAVSIFLSEQVSGKIALLPEGHDPDTFIRQQGLAALKKLISEAETLPEFVVERMIQRHGLTLDGKAKIVQELEPLLSAAVSPLQRSVMAAHFAKIIGITADALLVQPSKKGLPTGRPPVADQPVGRTTAGVPLTGPLKSLVAFMVMNPPALPVLEGAGLGDMLATTVGEVIYLQLKILHERNQGEVQPEDLLNELPEGEERGLVASILLEPGLSGGGQEEGEDALKDVVRWLQRAGLKRRSDALMKEISAAQKSGDFSVVSGLMQQKLRVDAELKQP